MASEPFDQTADLSAHTRHGSYPIPLIAPTTVGFLGRTARGPVNEPVVVESFPEFCRYFGSHFPGGAVSQAAQDFFLHGGRRAVIVRVTNRATRARIEIPAGDGVLRLRARYPGRHENLRVSIDYEHVEDDEGLFNLVVQRLGTASAGMIEDQEIYPMISIRRDQQRFVGTVLEQSGLIALDGPPPEARPDAMPPRRPGESMRYIGLTVPGDDGAELTDYDIIGSDRDGTGLFAFLRGPRPDLLAIPTVSGHDPGSTAFVAAARFCERYRALLIWDPPSSWQSTDAALLGARRLGCASSNIVSYFPRVRSRGSAQRDSSGVPACGAIAGMLDRRGRRGLWGRGEDADYALRSALIPVLQLSTAELGRLCRYGFNGFIAASGSGPRLAGLVTLNSEGLDRRRLALFILNSIEAAAMAASGDSNTSLAIVRFEGQLRRFFDDLYMRGAFAGKTVGQAYYLHAASGDDSARELCFGYALAAGGRFAEYRVALDGAEAGRIRRLSVLEAEQLFS